MADPLIERLAAGPAICCDGGMGSLITSAVPRLRCPEEANIRAPESVLSLHLGFIRAGAELIETNTFGANRLKLAARFLDDDVERINSEGVKIAREARQVSGQQVFIAGAIGPLGDVRDAEEERRALFAEQAELLAARGVDLFFVETFYDLGELETAIDAVRSGLVAAGRRPADLRRGRADARGRARAGGGTAAPGARSGRARRQPRGGAAGVLAALEGMGADGPPLAALPNLGLAGLAGGRIIFPHATPEYFAEFTAEAIQLGAALVGGCCGTTPTEIAAIRSAVDEGRRPRAPFHVAERELAVAAAAVEEETRLARDLREGTWVVSIQLDPPLGGSHAGMLDVAREIKASGLAEYVDINDNATARAAMSGVIMAARDRARRRDRDDPAPDAARLDDHGPRIAAARRARRGRPQRPRRHGRPSGGRRLPGLAGRLRGRLDRPDELGLAPECGRGLQRQGDRRADLVLPRRRRQPDRRRSRARGRRASTRRSPPARGSR